MKRPLHLTISLKVENLCMEKPVVNKRDAKAGKIFATRMTGSGLTSLIYKEHLEIKKKETTREGKQSILDDNL